MDRAKAVVIEKSKTAGADFLQLDVGEAPPGGRADWLAARLRSAIADGRAPVGTRLPASRVLAAELGVSRGVVTEAYQRLAEDGQVAGRGRAGTVVVASPAAVVTRPPRPRRAAEVFAGRPGLDAFDELRAVPAEVDLTPGVPDLAAFPRAAWLRAERAVLHRMTPAALAYGDPAGAPALRSAVANWLARSRGVRADPAEVVIVAGVSQALGLLARVLRDRGTHTVAVEDPGSLGVRQHLAYSGLATPPVPVDDRGLRVDELERSGAPAVLLTPAHQFPTGVVLDGDRRRRLLRWARDGGLVVEDDYDAEHRYDRPPVPALRGMAPDRVCYVGSISKLLAPALRIGWLLVPPALHADTVAAKRAADLGNAALAQLVLAELMESGALERHLRLLRHRHVRRRDAMIRAVRAYLPGAVVHGAAAGLHLMVTLSGDVDDRALAAAALRRGVKVHPLSWHGQRPQPPGLVLGYAATPPFDLDRALSTVAEALRTLTPPR
ncbi:MULTISPECIES: PLP-dependent aminotransferase family protein [unclassified Micromonospora]|uniref:MocR-like pyridoxine biosynthesis transcription factor PdxR n=1 Tax=unclassified Micromonospora TaxID=2617518 RepID=UPI00188E14A7|nr:MULTISPECIES: PLP-dependent aminotransferase family protein [unclassified Micromonospora]MBF5033958.1 PLP-dependent aminotransferase family protein [Micromonospora sp. ANENR4]MCZ7475592.1 PLP-dependent aminotransferase family protein [Micromonospora sp. WMMC273]WBC06200.1 PLP-dependent aminotransferase family protein [Micromonospora sp. WMMA1976]